VRIILHFTVVDITQFPHRVVAKYRNNEIKPMMFPKYNLGSWQKVTTMHIFLCEVNDIGDQVASIITI
jgi:hypothetical protein